MKKKKLNLIRLRRARRTRAKIFGTAEKPRFSVFRSNRYTYAQLIDDKAGKTLISVSTHGLPKSGKEKKQDSALKLGELIAQKAIEKGVKKAVFDRGKYKYHGRIKAIAEGARKGGLQI
jgi:large subunit ribosomal protein L18